MSDTQQVSLTTSNLCTTTISTNIITTNKKLDEILTGNLQKPNLCMAKLGNNFSVNVMKISVIAKERYFRDTITLFTQNQLMTCCNTEYRQCQQHQHTAQVDRCDVISQYHAHWCDSVIHSSASSPQTQPSIVHKCNAVSHESTVHKRDLPRKHTNVSRLHATRALDVSADGTAADCAGYRRRDV